MKIIQLLESTDIVLATDYCRPLIIMSMLEGMSDEYSFEEYGSPVNNSKWTEADRILPALINKSVGEINSKLDNMCGLTYEFIRGELPKNHIRHLTMTEWVISGHYDDYLDNTVATGGQYKGKTMRFIRDDNKNYWNYAIRQGWIKGRQDKYDDYVNHYYTE